MNENGSAPGARRLTRGHLELRGRIWWNRFAVQTLDPQTGETIRRQSRLRLGEFRSEAQASAALDRYLALQGPEALQPGLAITFGDYAARFDRLRIALMRAQSRRAYRSIVRNHLEPLLGAMQLQAIDATAAQELVAQLHERGLSPATIGTVVGRLREILRHARAAGFAAHVIPRAAVRLPSASRAESERRHISAEELARILTGSCEERRVLWAILGFAGLRIGEALGLTWENVDFVQGVILVRQAAVNGEIAALKTRTARRDVPMLPQLVAILNERVAAYDGQPSGLLFKTRTGRPRRADDVRARWLRPMLEELGLPPAGCHAFRHGLPGRLDELGLSPAAIQRFMGHATITMTERYTHRSTADLKEQLIAALRRKAEKP